MRTTNIVNDDDGDYHYVYGDELYPIGTLTTKTPVTPLVMLDPPPKESTQGKGIKILPPKQKLQRLPILLAQAEAGNTSENILNEIRQIVYLLYIHCIVSKQI